MSSRSTVSLQRRGVLLAAGLWFCVQLRMATALVVTSPCCKSFHHIPALFGSSIFDEHYSLKDVKVVPAAPLDACSELSEQVPRQQVVLIERGGCNFTTKVLHAQNHGARAAIVFNNEETHRWAIAMEADSTVADELYIPSVFVAHKTGVYLQAHSDVVVTLNATGHVFQRRLLFGPMETLATYVLVSFALLTCAGGLGLTLAVFVTYIQRSSRESAVARLKTVRYSKSHVMAAGMFVGGAQLPFELMERYGRNIGQFFQASEAFIMLSSMIDSLKASTPELIQAIASRAPDVWPVMQSIVKAKRPWQALMEHLQPVPPSEVAASGRRRSDSTCSRSPRTSVADLRPPPLLRRDSSAVQQGAASAPAAASSSSRSDDSAELAMNPDRHSESTCDDHHDGSVDTAPELTPVPDPPRLRMQRYLSVQPCSVPDDEVRSGGALHCQHCSGSGLQPPRLKSSQSASDLQACRPEFLDELSRERAERRHRFEPVGHAESKGCDNDVYREAHESSDEDDEDWPQAYFKNMSELAQRFGEGIAMKLPDFDMFDGPFSTGQVRMSLALQRLMEVYHQFFVSVSDTAQSYVNTAMNASNSIAASEMARQLRQGINSLGSSAQTMTTIRFKSTMCAICLEEFVEGELLTELPCGHLYHPSCIGPWLSTKSTNCPLCKQPAIPNARVEVFERMFGDMVWVLARQWQVLIAVLACLAMAAVGAVWVLAEVNREDVGVAVVP